MVLILNKESLIVQTQQFADKPTVTMTSASLVRVYAGLAWLPGLGKAGKRVAVVEKDFSEQDRIVGELLQPGGVQKLHELGLESCLEGIDAAEVTGYAIFKEGKQITIPYPSGAYTAADSATAKFVQNLRKKMAEYPNVTRVEGTVNKLRRNETGKIVGITYTDRRLDTQHDVEAELYHRVRRILFGFPQGTEPQQICRKRLFLGLITQKRGFAASRPRPRVHYGYLAVFGLSGHLVANPYVD